MSTDYASQKVAELQDLLKARGLPHTGKKADLIARLEASDSEKPATTTEQPATASDADTALEQGSSTNQQPAQPAQTQSKTPAPPEEASDSTEAKPTASAAAEAEDDSAQAALPAVSLEQEIEKRRKRAERFGTGKSTTEAAGDSTEANGNGDADKASTDAQRLLERQKRFGGASTDDGKKVTGLDALNQALPERQRKRGRQGGVDGEREGKRRDSRRRERETEGKEAGKTAPPPPGKKNSEQMEKDRLAAEKRKARFATSQATAAS